MIFTDKYFTFGKIKGSFAITAFLSLCALSLFICFPSAYRLLILVAMLLSSAGDVFLIDGTRGKRFIYGATAFGLAHIAYTAAYIVRAGGIRMNIGTVLPLAVFVGAIIALSVMQIRKKGPLGIFLMIIGYVILITAANFAVSTAAVHLGGTAYIALLGSLSFMASDMFIGIDVIGKNSSCTDLIWWFYPIGQLLLIVF